METPIYHTVHLVVSTVPQKISIHVCIQPPPYQTLIWRSFLTEWRKFESASFDRNLDNKTNSTWKGMWHFSQCQPPSLASHLSRCRQVPGVHLAVVHIFSDFLSDDRSADDCPDRNHATTTSYPSKGAKTQPGSKVKSKGNKRVVWGSGGDFMWGSPTPLSHLEAKMAQRSNQVRWALPPNAPCEIFHRNEISFTKSQFMFAFNPHPTKP